jgi:hypothetical protein
LERKGSEERKEKEEGDGSDSKFVEQTSVLDTEQSERQLLESFFATNTNDIGEFVRERRERRV